MARALVRWGCLVAVAMLMAAVAPAAGKAPAKEKAPAKPEPAPLPFEVPGPAPSAAASFLDASHLFRIPCPPCGACAGRRFQAGTKEARPCGTDS